MDNKGNFSPDGQITRAQFTTMITKVLSLREDNLHVAFSDTPRNAWYYPFVAIARKHSCINGYPDNTFKPDRTINKNELLTISANSLINRAGYDVPQNRTDI